MESIMVYLWLINQVLLTAFSNYPCDQFPQHVLPRCNSHHHTNHCFIHDHLHLHRHKSWRCCQRNRCQFQHQQRVLHSTECCFACCVSCICDWCPGDCFSNDGFEYCRFGGVFHVNSMNYATVSSNIIQKYT